MRKAVAFSAGGWLGVGVLTWLGVPFVWALLAWLWVLTIAFLAVVLRLIRRPLRMMLVEPKDSSGVPPEVAARQFSAYSQLLWPMGRSAVGKTAILRENAMGPGALRKPRPWQFGRRLTWWRTRRRIRAGGRRRA